MDNMTTSNVISFHKQPICSDAMSTHLNLCFLFIHKIIITTIREPTFFQKDFFKMRIENC